MAGFNVTLTPIITNIAKDALQVTLPWLRPFSIGIEMGRKSAGDKARIFLYGAPEAPTAFNESSNDYETATAVDLDQVEVTLTAPKKITKTVTMQQLANGLELRKLINGMVRRVAMGPVADAMALITNANFGAASHVGAASTLTSDKLADLAGIAADLGWDTTTPDGLHAVLNTAYYGNLVKDDDLKVPSGTMAEQLIKTGIVPTLSGFLAYRYPGLPVNAEALAGFITDGSGLAIAYAENQLEMGVEKHLEMYEVVTIPGGPIVSIRLHGSAGKNRAFLTVESLTGVAVGRAAGLKRITTT